jgi:hypothetical protein
MSKKDIFAPPSESEMKSVLSTAPTAEELAQLDEAPEYTGPELDPMQAQELLDSPLEAALQGFNNNAAQGFGDEINAAGLKALGKDDAGYSELVAKEKARRELLKKYNPVAYGAGSVGGVVATLPLALGNGARKVITGAAESMPLIGKYASMAVPAVEGAILGGVNAAGESEGSLLEDPMTLIKDTAQGVATGFGLGTAGGAVADKVAKSKELLEKQARLKALKAFGINPKKDLKSMSEEQVMSLGQTVLDNDFLSPLGAKGSSLQKLQGKLSSKESELENTLRQMSLAGVPEQDKEQLAKEIIEKFTSKYPGAPDNKLSSSIQEIKDWVGLPQPKAKSLDMPEGLTPEALNLTPPTDYKPTLSIQDMQDKKTTLNPFIKDSGFANQNPGLLLDTYLTTRQGFRKALEDQAEKAANANSALFPTEALNLKGVNKDLGELYKLQDVAQRENLKTMLGTDLDSTSKLSMLASAASGDIKPLVTGGLLKAGKEYGDNIAALSAQKAAKSAANIAPKINSATNLTSRLSGSAIGSDEESTGTVHHLSEMEAPQLQELAELAMQNQDKESQELAELLNKTAQKTGISKTANLFKIMQNPEYRKRLNELNKK